MSLSQAVRARGFIAAVRCRARARARHARLDLPVLSPALR